MTWSNVLSRPSGTKRARRRNFREFDVTQKTFLVCYGANVDLLWNAFMVLSVCTRVFWPAPTDHSSMRMNKHRVEVRQTNRLNRGCERNWIFHCRNGNVGVKVFRVKLPIRMNFDLDQLPLLWGTFEISQVIFPSVHIRVQDTMNQSGIPFRPEAMSR